MTPSRSLRLVLLAALLLLPTLAAPAQADDRLLALLPSVKAADAAMPALEAICPMLCAWVLDSSEIQ